MAGLKGLKKRRRIQIIVLAFVFMALAVGLAGYAFRDGINYFRSPSEVFSRPPAEDEVFRLGGLVKVGSIMPGDGVQFSFVVTDGTSEVAVRYVGANPRPDLFDEGQGTIATGRMVGDVFEATEILAKHDENYMPREVIDALKAQGVYKDPAGN